MQRERNGDCPRLGRLLVLALSPMGQQKPAPITPDDNLLLGDFSVPCFTSLQPELVAGPWGCPTDMVSVPKLASPPSLQCHLKNCLFPRSQSNLDVWGPLQSVIPGRRYPRPGGWEGREGPLAPALVLTSHTSFFSRSRSGGAPTSRCPEV